MSWQTILPARHPMAARGITMSCTPRSTRRRQRLFVSIGSFGRPSWLERGERVEVRLGADDHAGQMMLLPAAGPMSKTTAFSVSGRTSNSVLISIIGVEGLPAGGATPTPVEWSIDGGLVITLPPWLQPAVASAPSAPSVSAATSPAAQPSTKPSAAQPSKAPAAAQPPAKPTGARPKSAPFTGVGSGTHADVFAGRRGSGPVTTGGGR